VSLVLVLCVLEVSGQSTGNWLKSINPTLAMPLLKLLAVALYLPLLVDAVR
jgi:hypothetical protein